MLPYTFFVAHGKNWEGLVSAFWRVAESPQGAQVIAGLADAQPERQWVVRALVGQKADLALVAGLARQLGRQGQVFLTSGALAAPKGLDLSSLGRQTAGYELPLVGSTPAMHDQLSGQRGGFVLRLNRSLGWWQAGLKRRVRFTVLKSNFRHLPELTQLARRLEVRDLTVEFPLPEGVLLKAPSASLARYPLAAPWLGMLLKSAKASGLKLTVTGLPPCVLTDAGLSAWLPRLSAPLVGQMELNAGGLQPVNVAHARVARCEGCPHQSRCPGVAENYLRIFGEEEWRPARSVAV